jgi:alginate O-acetyltransferase complex protein AlgI
MLFNSSSFLIFLPIVFGLYWFFFNKSLKLQNVLLLLASYYFYSCWDWRFSFLLLFSTVLDYYTGLQINTQKSKKLWLWISVLINLGFLGVFKYYNFFTESFYSLLNSFGFNGSPSLINVILPVGISFYTFHGLSYVIDIYKNRISPEKNFVNYAVFVSFFPLLVAGPIERATHLLPQIKKERIFNYANAVDGLRQILWGLFKKVVIADQCAEIVNSIFADPSHHNGSTLAIGAILFSFQIYGDFSGYSDIALGTARLFGIELLKNFSFPYFSRDIAEFWRRWHISLSSWFKDYLYIPLGGSKKGLPIAIRNTFVIFIVSGFWHGANWTFICWGLLNALFILPSIFLNRNRQNLDIVASNSLFPSITEFFQLISTFLLCTFAWIFFRSENMNEAWEYITHLFSFSLLNKPTIIPIKLIILILVFITIEWISRRNNHGIEKLFYHNKYLRRPFYLLLVFLIFFSIGRQQEFIYFQF